MEIQYPEYRPARAPPDPSSSGQGREPAGASPTGIRAAAPLCWCRCTRNRSWALPSGVSEMKAGVISPSLYSVAIFVHDIGRAIEFYRDTLGLPLTKQGSFGAEFLEGETHVGVHPAIHPEAKSLVGRRTGITLFV